MRRRTAKNPKAGRKKSCGNGGSVERVESQKQASHSFHEPLEISPTAGEIPTFPQLRLRRRMETCKTRSRFFTFPPPRIPFSQNKKNKAAERASPSARRRALRAPPKS